MFRHFAQLPSHIPTCPNRTRQAVEWLNVNSTQVCDHQSHPVYIQSIAKDTNKSGVNTLYIKTPPLMHSLPAPRSIVTCNEALLARARKWHDKCQIITEPHAIPIALCGNRKIVQDHMCTAVVQQEKGWKWELLLPRGLSYKRVCFKHPKVFYIVMKIQSFLHFKLLQNIENF